MQILSNKWNEMVKRPQPANKRAGQALKKGI
jgi:hypothetical protein